MVAQKHMREQIVELKNIYENGWLFFGYWWALCEILSFPMHIAL